MWFQFGDILARSLQVHLLDSPVHGFMEARGVSIVGDVGFHGMGLVHENIGRDVFINPKFMIKEKI